MTPTAREHAAKIIEGLRLCRDGLKLLGLSALALDAEILALKVEVALFER